MGHKTQKHCTYCDKLVMAERATGIDDNWGCLFTLLTGGFFLLLWIPLWLLNLRQPYRCPQCGSACGYTKSPIVPLLVIVFLGIATPSLLHFIRGSDSQSQTRPVAHEITPEIQAERDRQADLNARLHEERSKGIERAITRVPLTPATEPGGTEYLPEIAAGKRVKVIQRSGEHALIHFGAYQGWVPAEQLRPAE